MKLSRRCYLSLLALTLFAPAIGAVAQTYPSKPIRLVVADAPGGAPEVGIIFATSAGRSRKRLMSAAIKVCCA